MKRERQFMKHNIFMRIGSVLAVAAFAASFAAQQGEPETGIRHEAVSNTEAESAATRPDQSCENTVQVDFGFWADGSTWMRESVREGSPTVESGMLEVPADREPSRGLNLTLIPLLAPKPSDGDGEPSHFVIELLGLAAGEYDLSLDGQPGAEEAWLLFDRPGAAVEMGDYWNGKIGPGTTGITSRQLAFQKIRVPDKCGVVLHVKQSSSDRYGVWKITASTTSRNSKNATSVPDPTTSGIGAVANQPDADGRAMVSRGSGVTPVRGALAQSGNGSGVPALDTDRDGLPDAWEMRYFGNLSPGPNEDLDGDGLTNLMEYRQGLNPLCADSDGDGVIDQARAIRISTPHGSSIAR
jgi:hypothetical protein